MMCTCRPSRSIGLQEMAPSYTIRSFILEMASHNLSSQMHARRSHSHTLQSFCALAKATCRYLLIPLARATLRRSLTCKLVDFRAQSHFSRPPYSVFTALEKFKMPINIPTFVYFKPLPQLVPPSLWTTLRRRRSTGSQRAIRQWAPFPLFAGLLREDSLIQDG